MLLSHWMTGVARNGGTSYCSAFGQNVCMFGTWTTRGAFSDTSVCCGFAKKGLRVSRLPNLKTFGAEITYVTYQKLSHLSKILSRCWNSFLKDIIINQQPCSYSGALFVSSLEFLTVHCWEAMLQDKPSAVPGVATHIFLEFYLVVGFWIESSTFTSAAQNVISKTHKFHCDVFTVGNFLQISFPANFVSLRENASPSPKERLFFLGKSSFLASSMVTLW